MKLLQGIRFFLEMYHLYLDWDKKSSLSAYKNFLFVIIQ